MKSFGCVLFPFLLLPQLASAKPAICHIEAVGVTYVAGPCEFTPLGGGDFRIDSEDHFWFAYVSITGSGRAEGFWNGDPSNHRSVYIPTSHAHTPSVQLRRNNACWENRSFSICAW